MLLADHDRIQLALGFHHHQPIGNWDWVIEDGYQHTCLPFLDVLERHPTVRITMHFDGHLLEWLQRCHPEFIERLRHLVLRQQVELLGGGFYEPILSIIPDGDKIGQIQRLSDAIAHHFGERPTGMWLPGRVWEPHLPRPIAQAGLRYTVLDDAHFAAVGLNQGDRFGYFQTEEQGYALSVFPISSELRAQMPFGSPERVIEILRSHATPDGSRLIVAFDDGEKFGGWPDTYQTVYVDGWLERFFSLLEQNQDWIVTTTPARYQAAHKPWGRVYLPSGACQEIQEWALPGDLTQVFQGALADLPQPLRGLMRGGDWRHFLVKYPEANHLHKKMLRVSRQLEDLRPDTKPPGAEWLAAQDALWRGQSNDPYWHGVFGGIYLNHLRSANYQALLQAEAIADGLRHGDTPFCELEQVDFDQDGATEALVSTRAQNVYVKATCGGAILEQDLKAVGVNLLDTLARRPEPYHQQIATATPIRAAQPSALGARPVVKETGLERFLNYDWYRRLSLIDHFFHPDTRLETLQNMTYGEQGDFVNQSYSIEHEVLADGVVLNLTRDGHVWVGSDFWPIRIAKRLFVPRDGAGYTVDYTVTQGWERPVSLWFGVEFNVNMRAGTGPERYYYSRNGRFVEPSDPGGSGKEQHVSELGLRDDQHGIDLHWRWDQPGDLYRFPVETVSRSESGFERVYQSSVILPNWRLQLLPDSRWRCRIVHEVSIGGSHASL
jgi:hypothetical protein